MLVYFKKDNAILLSLANLELSIFKIYIYLFIYLFVQSTLQEYITLE